MADKSLAMIFVAVVPDFAGKSATPYQAVWQEGEDVLLLCADGRKVRFNPEEVNRVILYAHLLTSQPVNSVEGVKVKSSPKASSQRGKK